MEYAARSPQKLPLSEKVKIVNKERKAFVDVAQDYGKNESSTHDKE